PEPRTDLRRRRRARPRRCRHRPARLRPRAVPARRRRRPVGAADRHPGRTTDHSAAKKDGRVTNLLEVRDARLAFGGLQALGGVSLSVPHGSIVGLIGPNGAGKTTLFNSISGLQRLDGGTVIFDDRDVTALPAHKRAALGIGRSFQHLGLMMDESVETNVLAAQHLGTGYGGADLLLHPARWLRGERELKRRAARALDAFGLSADAGRPVQDLSFAAAR